MAYQAIYRKWRPTTFEDVVGQSHITDTLKTEIKTDRLAHAYLFCGTRGTGKTTTLNAIISLYEKKGENKNEICRILRRCRWISSGT